MHKQNGEIETTTVCVAHLPMITSLSALCASLKWLTRLGFAMIPVSLYMLSEMMTMKQQITAHAEKIATITEKLAKVVGY